MILAYAGATFLKSFTLMFLSIRIYLNETPFFVGAAIILSVFLCLCFFTLCVSLSIGYCRWYSWFLPDTGSRNPYQLVYDVFCFARRHSIPIQRSAFTFCEDELPSRLDLGKEKYGGPFTIEQVENVKVFSEYLKDITIPRTIVCN